MRKHYRGLFLFLVLVLFPMLANAQLAGFGSNGLEFNTPGGGARAAGMGGAGLALAEGEMAFSWNPAAMIYTDKARFGIDFLSSANKQSYEAVGFRPWDTRNPNIQPYEIDFSHTSISYGGFAVPFSLDSDSEYRYFLVPLVPIWLIEWVISPPYKDFQLAFGGGYRHIFDMDAKYDFPGFDNSFNTFEQNRGLDAVTFAFAAKIIGGIGYGVNLNAYVRGTEYNHIAGNSAMVVNEARTDTFIVDTWDKAKSNFSGFNADFGWSVKFNFARAGLVLHTPYNLKQKTLYTWQVVIPPEPAGAIDRVTYTYRMPMGASFGVALTPIDNLALAFDYDYQPLSKVEIKTDWEQTVYSQLDITAYSGWEDVNQFRIGAEYSIDAGFATIPLRVGMRNEPLVGKEITDHFVADVVSADSINFFTAIAFGDQITTNILTFGTGLTFDKVWIGLAYQLGSSSYNRTVKYFHTDISIDPDAATETLYSEIHEIKKDYSKLFFSVGMYF